MLTSRAFGGLAKLLEALRAHDALIVEALAEQQAPSRYKPRLRESTEQGHGAVPERMGAAVRDRDAAGVAAGAPQHFGG